MTYMVVWNSKGASKTHNYIGKDFETLPEAKRYLAKYLADRHMSSGSILVSGSKVSKVIVIGNVEVTYSGIGVYIDRATRKASIIR